MQLEKLFWESLKFDINDGYCLSEILNKYTTDCKKLKIGSKKWFIAYVAAMIQYK